MILAVCGALASCCPSFTTSLFAQEAKVTSKLQKRSESYNKPAVIRFDGPIDFQNTAFFKSRLAKAKAAKVDLLILQIDSPGGLLYQSLEIAEALRDVTWAYTVAYVPREAISGAAIISLGCDEIVVGSQARFGDAGAIQYDPNRAAFQYVPAKDKSFLVRQARDLASAKERPPELAEAMVDEKAVVYVRTASAANAAGPPGKPTGKREYKVVYLTASNDSPTKAAQDAGLDLAQWQLVAETGSERFLTVNGPRAVELGFADHVIDDRESLLNDLKSTDEVIQYQRNFTDGVVYWLNLPFITGLLIMVGMISLYFELSAPGVGFGGLLAGLCATLFFWSRFAGGTSGWLEVILFVAGIVFLLMEIFVIPGFGFSGFTGLLLIFVSAVMASQDFVIPETSFQWSQLLNSLVVILVASCLFLVGAVFISKRFGSIPLLNRISLQPPVEVGAMRQETDKETGKPIPQSHPMVSVGDWGTAESLLRPAGRATFQGKSIDVVSDGSFLDPGTQIRIVSISGNRIVVSEVEKNSETTWKRNPADSPSSES